MTFNGRTHGDRPARDRAGGRKPAGCAAQRRLDERMGHRRVVVGVVDGSPQSAVLLRCAASQARQRSATLDVVYVLPAGADTRAATMARVRLGEFTRRVCPYGAGVPVSLHIERGNRQAVLLLVSADAELLVTDPPVPPMGSANALTAA